MKRILLVSGKSGYGMLAFIIAQMARAFERMGHATHIIDYEPCDEIVSRIKVAADFAPHYCIALNAMGCNMNLPEHGNKTLFDAIGCKFHAYFVDHPLHHAGRLNFLHKSVKNYCTTFVDKNHVKYWRATGANYKCEYMPLAGCMADAEQEKKIDVLFCGTLDGADKYTGNDFSSRDHKMRQSSRESVYNQLVEAGVEFKLVGNAAEKYRDEDYLGQLSPEDYLTAVAGSKIVLDVGTNLYNCPHDRALTGLLNGCVVVSDSYQFWSQNKQPAVKVAEDDVGEQCAQILNAWDATEYDRARSREWAYANHTWSIRCKEIIDMLEGSAA